MADPRPRFRLPWLVSAPAPAPAAVRPAAETQAATQPPQAATTARPPILPARVVGPPPPAALPTPPPLEVETEPTPVQQPPQLPAPPTLPPSTLPPPQTAITEPPSPTRTEPQSQVSSQIPSPAETDQPPATITLPPITSLAPTSTSQPAELEAVPSSVVQTASSTEQTIIDLTPETQGGELTQQDELSPSSDQKPDPEVAPQLENIDQKQPSPQEMEQKAATVPATESDTTEQDQTKAPDAETTQKWRDQENIETDDAMILKSGTKFEETEARIQREQDHVDERTKVPTDEKQKVDANLFLEQGHGKEEQDHVDERTKVPTGRKLSEPAIPTYPRVSRPLQRSGIPTREKAPLHKEIKEDMSKLVQKLGNGQGKQSLENKPFSIITLAGENKGASMQLGLEKAKTEGFIRIQRGYVSNPDEGIETTTDGEGRGHGRKSRGEKADEETGTKAIINSNVQSINNSLVFNSSVNESNPGVQLLLSQNPTDPGKLKKETGESEMDTRKAKSSIATSDKLTYAPPTVRRRCLRGLFLESSDSDPEDPEKPQRHGCRYEPREKNKGITDDL